MLACDLPSRAAALGGAAAVVFAGEPPPAVYALGALVTIRWMTVFHPAQAALLPEARAVAGGADGGKCLLEARSRASAASRGRRSADWSSLPSRSKAAFLVAAAALLWSALLVARLRREQPAAGAAPAPEEHEKTSARREALAGFRTIAAEPKLRVIIGLYGAQDFGRRARRVYSLS